GDHDRTLPAQLRDGLLRLVLVEGLAVPPLGVGQERHAVPLLGPGHDQRGTVAVGGRAVGPVDLFDVVPVDRQGPPAERLGSRPSSGAVWPFGSANRALASFFGSPTSNPRWPAKRRASRWAADSEEVGCPGPAAVEHRLESPPSWAASSFHVCRSSIAASSM